MADIAIFRINYKSDFILTLVSDAGWMTPFCIKFWTGAPSQAYFVGYDGTTYTHCAPVEGEPTKLMVQFDDHHLPIGDLKFQIGYHFTVADFPTSVEDEVLNQASVIIEVDDAPAQVMLDLNGETAPEIEFSLPAYANEAQRIANEQQRIAAEAIRIANEESRLAAETIRQQNEDQRISNEESRVAEFARLKQESETATADANAAATRANEKAALAADKATLAGAAATLANAKAQLAADKAALADAAATLANDKSALAQQKAEYAQTRGDYAKAQGDYAKTQGDTAQADHVRAEADHTTAADDHSRAESDHTTAASDHSLAEGDHTTAASDHSLAEGDHTTAASDHSRAESDHTRAESDHAAVEVYVDSLGAFDISSYHATGDVLAKYADLTAALGTNGANIPDALRKGGMSVKFVQSSDNKYVQYRYMGTETTGNPNPFLDETNWQGVDEEPTAGSDNLVKSGGVIESINEKCLYANIKEIFSINGYVNQYGEFCTASTIVCTDYIDISTFYGVEYSLYVGANTVVAVYDSSKVFIDCVDYVNNSVNNRFSAFSQFENAKYIRFSCKKDYLDKAAIRFIISKNIVDHLYSSMHPKYDYIKNKAFFNNFGYYTKKGIWTNASTVKSTDFIDISDLISIRVIAQGVFSLCSLFDENKEFVESLLFGKTTAVDESIQITDSLKTKGKYIRVSSQTELSTPPFNDYALYLYNYNIDDVPTENSKNIISSGAVKTAINQLKVDTLYANAKDIFTLSGSIGEDGQEHLSSSSEFSCTDFIDISNFSGVEYSLYVGNNTITALYDTNKAYLGEVNCVNQSVNNRFVSFSQFENAKYIRFSCKKDYLDKVVIRFIISKDIANNLTNKLNFSNLGYYTQDGTYHDSSKTKLTGFVDITDLYAISVTAKGNFSAVSLFDSNKQFVESILLLSGSAVYEQVIYLNQYKTRGKYIRVCTHSERNSPEFNDYNVTLISLSDKLVADTLNPPQASSRYLSAYNYGAVGDGVTDDTEALEALFADAFTEKKAVYIPSGTYLIRRSLTLRTGMEVFGSGVNSVITKPVSVWTQITQNITENDEVLHVASTNGLNVGDQFYITNLSDITKAAARHCTVGVITDIDSANNTVTFKSSYDSIKVGAIRSQDAGCYLSTGIGLLRSWGMLYESNNVYIHDLKLDGNRASGEPMEWFNGLIHFDAYGGSVEGIPYSYHSHDHSIKNCTLINGSFDAISDQGEYNTFVENCVIKNCAMHGIHFGTGYENGRVVGCTMEGNETRGAAVFWCAGVKELIVSNNYIKNFYRGCSDEEYGGIGTKGVITNNIFKNITDSVINFPTAKSGNEGGDILVSNNMVVGLNKELFDGKYLNRIIISHNIITSVTGTDITIIKATNCEKVVVIGNICEDSNEITTEVDTTDSVEIVNENNLL